MGDVVNGHKKETSDLNLKGKNKFLWNQLNVNWLRPESALWRALDSTLTSKYEINPPSLDLGCGNGIHSFITAGGNFSLDYDWYINTNVGGFFENKDIYDAYNVSNISNFISEQPRYKFTFGLDHKKNLCEQARQLNFYDEVILYDANKTLPFENSQIKTVFSNILYWLNNPKRALEEINRILVGGGIALLFVPDIKFKDYCITYHWKEQNSQLLKKLNRGRSESMQWETSYEDFSHIVENMGFRIIEHKEYLSRLTLQIWDIGLRPISPYLIKMANKLSPEDRRTIKLEWIETIYELSLPIYEMDLNCEKGGFHFFVLEKL